MQRFPLSVLGFVPQTWEDPSFANPVVEGLFGDNDPINIVEIGSCSVRAGGRADRLARPAGIFPIISSSIDY
jgi:inorganic pyrophosphatase